MEPPTLPSASEIISKYENDKNREYFLFAYTSYEEQLLLLQSYLEVNPEDKKNFEKRDQLCGEFTLLSEYLQSDQLGSSGVDLSSDSERLSVSSPVALGSPAISVTSDFFVLALEDEVQKLNPAKKENLPIFDLIDDELMGLGTCKMSLDSTFTYLHSSRVLLDIVDDQWASDKLPDEVVKVVDPVPYLNISDDEDEKELQPNETWTDLGLEQFKFNLT